MRSVLTGGAIVAAAVAIVYSLLADEIRAWAPHLARKVVRSAAARLPDAERERYERDWLAEIAAWEDRPLSALGKALHIRFRVRSIRASVLGVSLRGERLSRMMDIAFSLFVLLALAPLLLGVAIAIALDSRGPVIVGTPRFGREGKEFRLLQFRTMYVGDELEDREIELFHLAGQGQPIDWDAEPRVTRVGRWLRRYPLQALPGILNVLRGEMSIVGPWPPYVSLRPEDNEVDRTPHVGNAVRPGVLDPSALDTSEPGFMEDGYWDRDRKIERAAAYARSRSFLGDVRFLLRVLLEIYREIRRGDDP